jgi:hypothetical protein
MEGSINFKKHQRPLTKSSTVLILYNENPGMWEVEKCRKYFISSRQPLQDLQRLQREGEILVITGGVNLSSRNKNFINPNIYAIIITSVAEPEPQGAASFSRSRSRNAMRLRLRQWYYK